MRLQRAPLQGEYLSTREKLIDRDRFSVESSTGLEPNGIGIDSGLQRRSKRVLGNTSIEDDRGKGMLARK